MSNGLFDAHIGKHATHGRAANELPIAVIGAGPVSLAAAAQLVERKMPFVLFEAARRPQRPRLGAMCNCLGR
jgi:NADPH-dependent 2,4-dienoyl-CoA reductase/sulfur reductase-like enzyme